MEDHETETELTDGGQTAEVASIRHRAVAYLVDPR
jgi:hypothetical protein